MIQTLNPHNITHNLYIRVLPITFFTYYHMQYVFCIFVLLKKFNGVQENILTVYYKKNMYIRERELREY